MQLFIKNFKCFQEETPIDINWLTVFAGANGHGKSSAIQAILFLRHTVEQIGWLRGEGRDEKNLKGYPISLNDNYCMQLGNSVAVLNKAAQDSSIYLGIGADDFFSLGVIYKPDDASELALNISEILGWNFDRLPIRNAFYYLNAERVGPRLQQPLVHLPYHHTGWQGEYTGQIIGLNNGYHKIDQNRCYPEDTENRGILRQVNNWMNFIMPGVEVNFKENSSTNSTQVVVRNDYVKDSILATNIGFGISYVLPIIANGLIAEPNSMFIVENPEAHLHPSAQSKVGQFLAFIANTGVYVIVETHSDHVINGLQLSVMKKVISPEHATINFFGKNKNESKPNITSIQLNKKGELTKWPRGFFDQSQVDYAELFKLRKNE